MRPTLALVLTIALAYAAGLWMPWWSAALAACLVMATLRMKPLPSFLLGFLAVFLFWGVWILTRSIANDHILAHRMSAMVVGSDNPWLLMALSAAIGGLMGGLGGLCGSLFMRVVRPEGVGDEPEADNADTHSEEGEAGTPAPDA
jgi:hypothetical protein